jgi:hypothetical protein
MMNERSFGGASSGRETNQRGITLFGQRVRLYLTPQTGEASGGFLAFEYVYSRQS